MVSGSGRPGIPTVRAWGPSGTDSPRVGWGWEREAAEQLV